ncbi:SEL1-like repeat protein [Piscinibacter terrae]|uniref:Sel1 repeat family protein n=1 Tax=Piscinibacter terrae TaxID=2496871 RepID=A0A3N7HUT1_9BURK|nr:tetratricopeptide repeat protein [Albitalea terrae]RQP25076.1 sel1 repeat family protein [Albitalea terrae]
MRIPFPKRQIALALLCVSLHATTLAQARPDGLSAAVAGRLEQVGKILDAAAQGNANAVWDAKTEIEELPYPARGDRKAARKLNTSALEKFKADNVPAALGDFEKAWAADPSDQEITNNYGYVLYRSQRLADAERLLRYTLALAPARAAAWANLAEVLGASGNAKGAAAAFMVSHRFSRNPETTRQYIDKFANSPDAPAALKEGAGMALAKLQPAASAASGSTSTAAALASTASERRAMETTELSARPPSGLASAPSTVANPMQKLLASLSRNAGDVPPLYVAAANGSTEARDTLLRMANAGDARAQNAVGNLFGFGRGVEVNSELANVWYRKSAEQGFVLSQFSLAWNQSHGIGAAVDFAQALDWYRRAAEQGHPFAMNNLGVMNLRGQGTAADAKAAFDWFNRAAEAGNARGAYNAGTLLEQGNGTPADARRAFAMYMSAGGAGFAQAQLKVAQGYEYGWSGTQDKAQAVQWYRKAAQMGLEPAKDALKRLGAEQE